MTDREPDPKLSEGLPELGDLGGLLGGGAGGGLGDLLAQAQEAMSASQAAASAEVEGSAGGGVVRVRMTGAGEPRSVHIDPAVVDPDDIETLEDLVVAALRDAQAAAARLHEQAMGGFDPSAMLGGLFGGAAIETDAVEDE